MIRSNTMQLITRTRLVTILTLIALAFAGLPATPARAATINLNDQASCEALGGIWSGDCRFYASQSLNVAAGDVLQVGVEVNAGYLTNNGTIQLLGGRYINTYFQATNNGTITVESGASLSNLQGTFTNNGTITVACGGERVWPD